MTHGPPGEEQVRELLEGWPALGHDLELVAIDTERVDRLDEQSAADALEVQLGDAVVAHALDRIWWDQEQLQARLVPKDPDRRVVEAGRDDRLVRVRGDLPRGGAVEDAIDANDRAERGYRVGFQRAPVGLNELVRRREANRVRVLGDDDGGRRVVSRDPVRDIEVEQVVERRRVALDQGRVGDAGRSVRGLPIECAALVGVLAIAQVTDLLEDHREALRVVRAGELVQVRRDLRVVGGDGPERLRGELGLQLRADVAALAQLGQDLRVLVRTGDRDDARGVAGGRAEEGSPTHIDHLDRLVDADERSPDLCTEGLHVDDHDIDGLDAFPFQLLELVGLVTAGEDPGVDRVVEGLDRAAEHRCDARELRDRVHLDPVLGEVVARAIRGKQRNVEGLEAPRKRGDAIPRRDREQRSQPQSLHVVSVEFQGETTGRAPIGVWSRGPGV